VHVLFGSLLAVDNGALLLVGGIAAFTLTLLAILYRPMPPTSSSAPLSTASSDPNSTCSRSTLEPRSEISEASPPSP
jgi:hypothetical protein